MNNNSNEVSQSKRAIRNSKYRFLMNELELWKEANLITQEQLSGIRAYYEVTSGLFSKVLVYLGVVLLGAALLSYIAANWMNLGRVIKISLILVIYIGLIMSAWLAEKKSVILSRALLLLGSFAYGGGIFLIAQIFHEGGHYTTALLAWIIGITPVCLLFKDRLQLSLIQVISMIYLLGVFLDINNHFYRYIDNQLPFLLLAFRWQIALVAGLWILWLRTSGRINFNLNILATIILIILLLGMFVDRESNIIFYLFCFGAILGLIPSGKYEDIKAWGITLIGVCGLFMTSHYFWRNVFYYNNSLDWNLMHFPFLSYLSDPHTLAVCSGIFTCALMVIFMLRGSILAILFFCSIILRYFFDVFYDFLPKSITFATGGIILVVLGLYLGKIHRDRRNKRTVNTTSEVTKS